MAIFAFAHRPACTTAKVRDYTQKRNLWFALKFAAFLAHDLWVYAFIVIPLLIYANRR